jgi:hypothetical protein
MYSALVGGPQTSFLSIHGWMIWWNVFLIFVWNQELTILRRNIGMHNFCSWCTSFNLNALPASNYTVSLCLMHLCKSRKSVSLVEEAFYAVSWSHKLAGFVDPCNSFVCKSVKEGAKRSIGHCIVNKRTDHASNSTPNCTTVW